MENSGDITVFETFAVLSTLGCIAVFVVMFRMDRNSRNDDARDESRR